MLKDKTLTYVSLFSCAGVGCYGFKQAGFECVATNELIERRIKVQKINEKCKFDTGYICDDITLDQTKDKIYKEIEKWSDLGNDRVDVLVATPPCQGMSVANHKKKKNEISTETNKSMVVQNTKENLLINNNRLCSKCKKEKAIYFLSCGCLICENDIGKLKCFKEGDNFKNLPLSISSLILNPGLIIKSNSWNIKSVNRSTTSYEAYNL